ncbi:MAG: cobalamin B12-binding domain-containing protein [Chloroflexi bacterium]|nr:cobalamin B12-binding domain-containing protein [Chloroflexota bacterium]
MASIFEEIADAVVKAESEAKVRGLTQKALDEGHPVKKILEDGLVKGMNEIGERWKQGDAFIPEVLLSAEMMRAGIDVVKELIIRDGIKPLGKVVIGTVQGDVHSIGKSLVGMMLQSSGFEVQDLGVDVTVGKFVEVVKAQKPDLLALSALLTTTMPAMEDTIKAVKKEGLKIKTIIGGSPTSQVYATSIGADGYASDAVSAVDKVKELLDLPPEIRFL